MVLVPFKVLSSHIYTFFIQQSKKASSEMFMSIFFYIIIDKTAPLRTDLNFGIRKNRREPGLGIREVEYDFWH